MLWVSFFLVRDVKSFFGFFFTDVRVFYLRMLRFFLFNDVKGFFFRDVRVFSF